MSGTGPTPLRAYRAIMAAASPLAPAILSLRAWRGKEERGRLPERLGRSSLPRDDGPLVWMHAASVGEGLSLAPLVERIRDLRPDVNVLFTTGTRASAALLARRLSGGMTHQFVPIDTPGAVDRFISHWRPDLGVFVESELWPNLILAARTSGCRLALVSARMSASSLANWQRAPATLRHILAQFDLILARDPSTSARLKAIGAQVDGVWDAKLGAPSLPVDASQLESLVSRLGDRAVIVAASTHSHEESQIARAFAATIGATRGARLIIAPRHCERAAEVESAARAEGLTTGRRSQGADLLQVQVLVADTMGELGLWYRLAALAFVGGSLKPGVGGHNPMEPARLGCPVVAGAHVNHWPVYQDLVRAGAVRLIQDADGLAQVFGQAVTNPSVLADMARNAREFARQRDGEVEAVAPRLLDLLAR